MLVFSKWDIPRMRAYILTTGWYTGSLILECANCLLIVCWMHFFLVNRDSSKYNATISSYHDNIFIVIFLMKLNYVIFTTNKRYTRYNNMKQSHTLCHGMSDSKIWWVRLKKNIFAKGNHFSWMTPGYPVVISRKNYWQYVNGIADTEYENIPWQSKENICHWYSP